MALVFGHQGLDLRQFPDLMPQRLRITAGEFLATTSAFGQFESLHVVALVAGNQRSFVFFMAGLPAAFRLRFLLRRLRSGVRMLVAESHLPCPDQFVENRAPGRERLPLMLSPLSGSRPCAPVMKMDSYYSRCQECCSCFTVGVLHFGFRSRRLRTRTLSRCITSHALLNKLSPAVSIKRFSTHVIFVILSYQLFLAQAPSSRLYRLDRLERTFTRSPALRMACDRST
jgi:hypothetical protein